MPDPHWIKLSKITQNNLNGFDLNLPLHQLIVVTGPSGSGKSSLAFDTIYAEGQRRYIETFSPYTRQFLERMDKPQVGGIEGIPPAIAVEQTNNIKTSRSTVGTITEINDYLKLLMSNFAQASCSQPHCSIQPESPATLLDYALKHYDQGKIMIAFPVDTAQEAICSEANVIDPLQEHHHSTTKTEDFFQFLQEQGYLRIWIDQQLYHLDPPPPLDQLPPQVWVIQDRITVKTSQKHRLSEAIETALRLGKGKIAFINPETAHEKFFSTQWECLECNITIPPPTPGLFSFNNPLGACPQCHGFGRIIGIDPHRVIPNPRLSIAQGAIKPFQTNQGEYCQKDLLRACAREGIDIHLPFEELLESEKKFIFQGEKNDISNFDEIEDSDSWYGIDRFFQWLERKSYKMHIRVLLSRYRCYLPCPSCHGGRFQPATLYYKLTLGGKKYNLPELAAMPVKKLLPLIESLHLCSDKEADTLLKKQLLSRLSYLEKVGLGYLSLDRPTKTLSGGEIARVNLTTCLGTGLVNTLFVMDEPTVGLHQRDVVRLLEIMHTLRDQGNTLLVVEHEETIIRAADYLVDLGPVGGAHGGKLLYSGEPHGILQAKESITADYLTGKKKISLPQKRRAPQKWMTLSGVDHHNLRNLDLQIPLGVFCCVTGVSGSGKSSLITDVLYQNISKTVSSTDVEAGICRSITIDENFYDIVMVDQSTLSKTPRSTPAIYLGFFDIIRELFGMTPEALAQKLTPSAFSFNSRIGRCERCAGLGVEKIEMQFLSDIYLRCPACDGKRYQEHILQIRYQGKNIHEILEMTAEEAILFFEKIPNKTKAESLLKPLKILIEVGLGYLKLGHPLNSLSGGESQRLKLAARLQHQEKTPCLLIFDEPTTGLHMNDVATLLQVFQRLVAEGHSLIIVEHHLDMIKSADWIIDVGPEAGSEGGKIVATGSPEEVSQCQHSHTGRYLKDLLEKEKEGSALSTASPELSQKPPAPPQNSLKEKEITIVGAREHNLKNISLTIPRDEFVVITGLSGSGKSTLAFDLLFAEGQRRFLDSMSPYARQFVNQMEKPDVDEIVGLPPTVAIEQRIHQGGGKSTVATITEVYQFLRLLYAKVGTQYCPDCHIPVKKSSLSNITKELSNLLKKGALQLYAPLIKGRKGHHRDVARWAAQHGFNYLLIDGVITSIEEFTPLERFQIHDIDLLVATIQPQEKKQLLPSLQKALEIGKGITKWRLLCNGDDPNEKNPHLEIASLHHNCPGCGRAFEEPEPRLFSFNSPHGWCPQCHGFGELLPEKKSRYRGESALELELEAERSFDQQEEKGSCQCMLCHGTRLNEVARAVQVQGKSITDLMECSAKELLAIIKKWKFHGHEKLITHDILSEVTRRLSFLDQVGLNYLQLGRSAKTLSGGESQRIRLAAQLGSNLRGVLYILDEPTIGLHPRDNDQLLKALQNLRSHDNSLLVVEHDETTMRQANTIIDLGPKAGREGGEIMAQGNLSEILENPQSLTAQFLKEPLAHPWRKERRSLKSAPGWLRLEGATQHNIEQLSVSFPLERFTAISGVSGSGKSTLLRGILLPAVTEALASGVRGKKRVGSSSYSYLEGFESLAKVIEVDQSPIGKTSRSTPATYLKIFNDIRTLYANTRLARLRGYNASRFSFNNREGRCSHCEGQGVIKREMSFLPTSLSLCEHCHGKRFNDATLEVLYNEKSIADVLEMTFEEATSFFKAHPKIAQPLQLLVETGLGYLQLGQASPTLSGGEAQRLKLVTQLARGISSRVGTKTKTLYILEEPTVGLHAADVSKLLTILHRLVDEGHTVIVVEHHLDLIAEADYVIDIGPEAAAGGGKIVAQGTPEKVAKSKKSRTAPFLREILMKPEISN